MEPYKRSKFEAFCEAQRRAEAGWPIVIALPTAPIGPHDVKPTPTGMIIVQFLNGRIPMLAHTGLNFVDVRQCALGHLLAMVRGEIGERYLLGGVNLWLGEFLQKLEPYAQLPRAALLRAALAELCDRLCERNGGQILAKLETIRDA